MGSMSACSTRQADWVRLMSCMATGLRASRVTRRSSGGTSQSNSLRSTSLHTRVRVGGVGVHLRE
jgi:hypothetical protein